MRPKNKDSVAKAVNSKFKEKKHSINKLLQKQLERKEGDLKEQGIIQYTEYIELESFPINGKKITRNCCITIIAVPKGYYQLLNEHEREELCHRETRYYRFYYGVSILNPKDKDNHIVSRLQAIKNALQSVKENNRLGEFNFFKFNSKMITQIFHILMPYTFNLVREKLSEIHKRELGIKPTRIRDIMKLVDANSVRNSVKI